MERYGSFRRPYGTRYIFLAFTPDLRPGLQYAAPPGLRTDPGVSVRNLPQFQPALDEQASGFAIAFVAVAWAGGPTSCA